MWALQELDHYIKLTRSVTNCQIFYLVKQLEDPHSVHIPEALSSLAHFVVSVSRSQRFCQERHSLVLHTENLAEISKTLRGPRGIPGEGRRGPPGEPGDIGPQGLNCMALRELLSLSVFSFSSFWFWSWCDLFQR